MSPRYLKLLATNELERRVEKLEAMLGATETTLVSLFVPGLRQVGWIEAQNVRIGCRTASTMVEDVPMIISTLMGPVRPPAWPLLDAVGSAEYEYEISASM